MEIACDLLALTPEQRGRRTALAETLREAVVSVTELPDGYALRLRSPRQGSLRQGSGLAREIEELMSLERKCCSFLRFAIQKETEGTVPKSGTIPSGSDTIELSITGEPGVKEFIAAQFGL